MFAPPHVDSALPTSKVELKVSCKGLANRDLTSFSDPQVFLFLEDSIGQWCKTPHAKTERIKDTLNPSFVQGLQVDYRFSMVQKLRFVVYDIDDKNSNSFSDQDFQGEVVTDLASIISAPGGQLTLKLYHPTLKQLSQDRGKITIRAEELKESKRVFSMTLKAKDLTKKGMFKTAPSAFVVIQRRNQNGTFSPVYKTHVVASDDDPKWKPFNIKENILCNGDPHRELRFDVMSWKTSGTHTLIGSTPITTPAKLSQQHTPYTMPLPGIRDSTALVVESLKVHEPPSFVDFMRGGGAINLMVAIDFTQSNGDPSDPTSLHFRHPSGENDYTRAIRAVGTVLEAYDSDRRIPVYGFGGKIGNEVSFAFPLNGDPHHPEVVGVDGILHAYWQSMSRVQLWGPTNFSPMIKTATEIARQSEAHGGYSVLLILTDGAITDFVETLQSIRKAAKYPLSIIIVGVGMADFGKMSLLDGDEEAESSVSLKDRDITQFVAARDFGPQNVHLLASALLQELPEQFMEYMSLHNKAPKPIQPAATMYDPTAAAAASIAAAAAAGSLAAHHPPAVHAPPAAAPPGPAPGYPHSPSLAPAPSAAPGAPGYPHSPSLAPVAAAAAGHAAPGYPPPAAAPPVAAPGYAPPTSAPPAAAPGYPPPTSAPPAAAPGYPPPTSAPPAGAPGYTHSPALAPGAPPVVPGSPAYSAPTTAPPAGTSAAAPPAAAPGYAPHQPYPGYPPAHQYPGYPPQPYYGYAPAQPGYPPAAGHPYPGYPAAQPYYGYAYPPPGHPPYGAAPYPGQYAAPPGAPPGAAPGAPPTSAPGAPPVADPHAAAAAAAAAAAHGAPPVPASAPGAAPAAGQYYQPYAYGAYAPPAGPPPPVGAPGAPGAPAPAPEAAAKAGEHAAGAVPPPVAPASASGATADALAASVSSLSIGGAQPPPAAAAPATTTTDASGHVAPAAHRPAAPQLYSS